MPAESDYTVGFGVPDTIAGIYGQSAVARAATFHQRAQIVGIEGHSALGAPGRSRAATAAHSMRRIDGRILLFDKAAGHGPVVRAAFVIGDESEVAR